MRVRGYRYGEQYFSGSIRDGLMPGSNLFAMSLTLKTSEVATKAINAAILAWRKGSRRDRMKAARRTLSRV